MGQTKHHWFSSVVAIAIVAALFILPGVFVIAVGNLVKLTTEGDNE